MVDTSFDFRSDTPRGRDPDSSSPTLRRYHQLLWSKALPSGAPFELDVATPPYLHHLSELGEFWLTSDTVIPSWSKWKRMSHITGRMSDADREAFNRLGYTIGGMMVFPGKRVGSGMTINGARGCNSSFADRFDLTVECIRRHYADQSSPLGDTLARYADFFDLFGGFSGYVEFFYLQDLVDAATLTVKFFTAFEDFSESPLPASLAAYLQYRDHAVAFIESRNRRIAAATTR